MIEEHCDADQDSRNGENNIGGWIWICEDREDLESNGCHQQDDVEDDVGIEEPLPVLPDAVNSNADEDNPNKSKDGGGDEDSK